MRNFHDQIRPLGGNRVPAFPPKKLFGNLKASFIEARRVQLEQYFQALQNIPDVSNSREFKQYLSPPDKNFLERPKPTLN